MKIRCIEHIWVGARTIPALVFKYGSFARTMSVCEVCGKIKVDFP